MMEESLFSWLSDQYTGDVDSRSAAKRVLAEVGLIFHFPLHALFCFLSPVFYLCLQLCVFYILIVIGFGGLWLTWHSNTKIKKVREDLKQALQQQRETQFDASDCKMYL